LIDDARTFDYIWSSTTGDRHEFNERKNWKSSSITASISKWFYLKQKLLKEGKTKEGGSCF
jgi:hypothetical protein